jgi:hypothetical protein
VHEFQEDTASWESRLTHLRGIFEVWVEVQRKWLYLRGIFKNADIKAQLPAQFTKFKSIDSEYLNITKRVANKPAVLDLLQLENLQRQLERQDTTMALIQKALGDYLEKQRQIFPVRTAHLPLVFCTFTHVSLLSVHILCSASTSSTTTTSWRSSVTVTSPPRSWCTSATCSPRSPAWR